MTRRFIAVLAVPFLALGFAACGGDTADLEKQITEELQRGYPGAKVDCPSDVSTDEGTTFTCKVTGSGPEKEISFKVNKDGDAEIIPAQ